MSAAVLRGGLKKGRPTILAETVLRTASTVSSMLNVLPTEALSRLIEARAIMRLRVGDHVVEVALPTWRPARYTGTATREADAGTWGGIPMFS